MSTASADNPPARRSTSLDDLPTELKAVVVTMVTRQDTLFDERTSPDDEEADITSIGETAWNGRSLVALRLVSREWRFLGAVEMYQVFDSRRCRDDFFAFDRVPRYGLYVRQARFRETDTREDHISLLRSLPQLRNLDTLSFDGESFDALFGGSSPSDQQELLRSSLQRTAPAIRSLYIHESTALSLVWAVPAFIHLQTLALAFNFGLEDKVEPVARVLGDIQGLRALTVHWMDAEVATALKEVVESGHWRSTSLERFSFECNHWDFTNDCWSFVKHLSPTLVTLRAAICVPVADVETFAQTVKVLSAAPAPFPVLRHLKLEGLLSSFPVQLSLFQDAPLTHLTLAVGPSAQPTSPASLPALDALFKTLARYDGLRLALSEAGFQYSDSPYRELDLSVASHFTRLADKHSIHFTLLRPYDVFLHRKEAFGDPGSRREQTSRRCDGADEVLRHALAESGRMRATGDLEGAESLVEALTPLRARMLRDRD